MGSDTIVCLSSAGSNPKTPLLTRRRGFSILYRPFNSDFFLPFGIVLSLDKHNTSVIFQRVNSKQMKKWLEQQGATFQPGKGSHLKVFLNGKQSALPMHGTSELGKGLEAAIKRQLGLK